MKSFRILNVLFSLSKGAAETFKKKKISASKVINHKCHLVVLGIYPAAVLSAKCSRGPVPVRSFLVE